MQNLVPATPTPTASYDYNAYGAPLETTPATAVDHRFAGLFYLQDAGLYLSNYRAYNPSTGKWLNRDPIAEQGGVNLYAYVGGNPVNLIDPTGENAFIYKLVWECAKKPKVCAAAVAAGCKQVWKWVKKGADKADDASMPPKEGRYEFPDKTADGKPYVGQSKNISNRLKQHETAGRYEPGTEQTTEILGGKTAREISEHQRIQEITGGIPAKQSDAVSNKVDPIGPNRRYLLPDK